MEIYPPVHLNQSLLGDDPVPGTKNRKVKDTWPYLYRVEDSHMGGKMDVQCGDC